MAHDVFISFSFNDQIISDTIVNHLTNIYKIPCWICTAEIRAGEDFYDIICDAITESKLVLFVQTKSSVKSKEVADEIFFALEEGKTIIPFIVEESELSGKMKMKLKHKQHIDGTEYPLEDRIKELARELCNILGKTFLYDDEYLKTSQYSLVSTSVELDRDDIFIGRDDLMQEIHKTVKQHPTVFLQGIGGIGKSELAKQYYYKYENAEEKEDGFYNKVVFARYDGSLASLIADDLIFKIEGLSRKIKQENGKDVEQTDEEYAREKITILKKICGSDTLFIIDNFDIKVSDEKLFFEFTDKAPYKVLVTTRLPQKEYKTVQVKELAFDSLKDVFIRYAGENSGIDENDPAFPELFAWTDNHTLTIELVAKIMNSMMISDVSEMLSILKEKRLDAFSEMDVDGQNNAYGRIKGLLKISNLSDDEIYFLRCLSIMPAAGVRFIDFFEKWISRETDKAYYWRSVLSNLAGRSLVKDNRKEKTVSLHPIIREVVINELKPDYDNCRSFIESCTYLNNDFYTAIAWNWDYETKSLYFDCYRSITDFFPISVPGMFSVYTNVSIMYNYIGGYEAAIEFHKKMSKYAKEVYGENSFENILCINRIAWKYSNARLYDMALPYGKVASDWFCENDIENSRFFTSVVQNYIEINYYLYCKDHEDKYYKEAFDYLGKYEQGMKKYKQNGSQNDLISKTYSKFYMEANELDLAEQYIIRFKDEIITKAKYTGTSEELDMASWHDHMSRLSSLKGDYLDALKHLEYTYECYLKYFSLKNPRVLNVLERFVNYYLKLGISDKALEYLSVAYDTAELIYAMGHPIFDRYKHMKQELEA